MRLEALELGGNRHAVDAFPGNDQEPDRMHRHEAAGRQHGALHALLSAGLQPRAEIGDQVERAQRFGRLGADGQGPAHLRHHDADLAGPHLHPRVLFHVVEGPEFPTPARHQQIGLIAGLALEGDGVVVGEFSARKPLGDQPHLGRTDDADRGNHQDHYDRDDGSQKPM